MDLREAVFGAAPVSMRRFKVLLGGLPPTETALDSYIRALRDDQELELDEDEEELPKPKPRMATVQELKRFLGAAVRYTPDPDSKEEG